MHHTVNANDYKRKDVPAIIRSIYAYHIQSRGWSDIGYNFLVDRFGRIWEGRYGGVDRPVVGAHTLNYNSYSFAMSAIGNFETAQPSTAMLQAYGALFAWKLSLHGVSAASTIQRIGSKNFQAINGHRDAASTACPGKYLYAKIPEIRRLAVAAQADWSGRNPQPNLVGTARARPGRAPDQRRAGDRPADRDHGHRRHAGQAGRDRPEPEAEHRRAVGGRLGPRRVQRHRHPVQEGRPAGAAWRRRRATSSATRSGSAPASTTVAMLAAVGDMTGDGYPDLMGQPRRRRDADLPGRGHGRAVGAASRPTQGHRHPDGRHRPLERATAPPTCLFRNGNALSVVRATGPAA